MTTGIFNTTRTTADFPRRARNVHTYEPSEHVESSSLRGSRKATSAPVRQLPRTGRIGSKQRVSVRGVRQTQVKTGQSSIVRWAISLIAVLILGVSAVMYLSGVTTEQSFQLADARQQSDELSNQLETLERDVAHAQSSANIAAKASELGMVAPAKSGILDVNGDKVEERRASDNSANREVIDINGDTRQRGATSNPQETNSVPGLAPSNPVDASSHAVTQNGLPYADRHATVPNPADAGAAGTADAAVTPASPTGNGNAAQIPAPAAANGAPAQVPANQPNNAPAPQATP
ncbi:hypothetical protein [Corynebacterium anserum]|uniref:Uncharacterized protein n=1 Tax=Corynebacterium anserum TaxID=2684406 RepID=A0A7G7YMY0_9CORY|nr:hypothetical protein [Corynebacterium anserum]MBC2680919.1 hypothetical protein [Corynebacterium anserum]QNH95850.1 hypothetical protein GP473_03410 [Corynebacterium anserum]